MFDFKNNAYPDDKVIINCRRCAQKLRVPRDAGKLSVRCPICKAEFIFDPNDIIFRISSYLKNTFSSLKRNVLALKAYGSVFKQVWKGMNGRYRR